MMLLLSVIPIKLDSVNAAATAVLMRCRFKNSATITAGAARVETAADIPAAVSTQSL